jgi:glucokinase
LIDRVLAGTPAPVAGIGIAAAGQIHPETHAVVYAPNLNWQDVPLKARIEARFKLPVWVENDVRAAAWGEFRFGAGCGARSLVAVFVGTGVGSGAVLGGKLWRGASNAAGEIGHTQVVPDGVPCVCGQRGCLEAYSSGIGLIRRFAAALATGRPSALRARTRGEAARLTALDVAQAAAEGDPLARELWEDAVRYLELALANAVTLLNPERLVLGGGVVETVPVLVERVATAIRERATLMARAVTVHRALLGAWAGVVGAADLIAGLTR